MKKWLKRKIHLLLHPCEHQWKCVHQVENRIYDEDWDKYPSCVYLTKTWECQKCGKIKYITQEL